MHGAGNGVAPEAFRNREVLDTIMSKVPITMEKWSDDNAILRIQIHGPPASGKTSIMGKLHEHLAAKYSGIPVYFVRSGVLNSKKNEVVHSLASVSPCIVLLDDAHQWYNFENFWLLFKNAGKLLVFAASFGPFW
jgi:Ni2+-binding GTPase involved in maturation of urease and hydrogenase